MTVDSLREYLGILETRGDLHRIGAPASWNLEASAVTLLLNQADGDVPLFEDVNTARLVGDPYRGSQRRPWDRIALGIGLPRDLSYEEYYESVI